MLGLYIKQMLIILELYNIQICSMCYQLNLNLSYFKNENETTTSRNVDTLNALIA